MLFAEFLLECVNEFVYGVRGACGNVECFSVCFFGVQGEQVGLDDVFYVDEVSGLVSVSENG